MITKFQIFEKRSYLNVIDGKCPVCDTTGKVIDKEETGEDGEYTIKCPMCDFIWKQEYYLEIELDGSENITYTTRTDINGNEIEDGFLIDDSLYNELKLQSNKYNL